MFGSDPNPGVVAVACTEPMDAPALAVAAVPELTVTMVGDAGTGGGALLVVRQYGAAVALIELGDGYLLDIDRARASVLLSNPLTGLRTTIWGEDAAMTLSDGAESARFWGNVTFALDNGAVITAATARREDNPMVYALDTLTVTKREAAVIITDIAAALAEPEAEPALTVTTARNGEAVEHRTRDGLVLEQDAESDGWVREGDYDAADGMHIAQTAPGALYGPDFGLMSGRELGRVLSWTTTSWSEYKLPVKIVPDRQVDDGPHRSDDRTAQLRRIYLASLKPHVSAILRGT
jgi:hypothetical protein